MKFLDFLSHNVFLNSPFLTTLVTGLVGSVALYIYFRQHNDEIMNGATTILGEITSAENDLKSIRKKFFANEQPALENKSVMPHESWGRYKHLFRDKFSSAEWKLIDNFYNSCISYDKAVELDASYFDLNTGPRFRNFADFHTDIVNTFIKDNPTLDEFTPEIIERESHFQKVYLNNATNIWYATRKPVNDARAALVELETAVSLSSAGQKLKKLAKIK